ncbi:MAG: NAD(P)-dependent glycerol-1-phosphate dehydrogenase [Candidatus Thermoplasmatota archaeon]
MMSNISEEAFTKAKIMLFPRQVIAGHGMLGRITDMCRSFNLKGTCVIVTGPLTKNIAGMVIADLLHDAGYNVHISEVSSADLENIKKVEELAKEVKTNFFVGVGGGSKIDVGKYCASKLFVPFISVPTSASHDGIASPKATIKNNNKPYSVDAEMPIGILADTSIIVKAPYRLLASGCADVIGNICSVKDWELGAKLRNEEFSSTACAIAKTSAENIIQNVEHIKPNSEESAWIAIKPMIASGITAGIAGSSRPISGSEHLFSHAVELISPGKALHGELCGIGAIMMMYLHGGDWEMIKDALKKISAPTTAKECNLSKEEIIKALTMAHKIRPERYTILGDNGLTLEAAEKLATITGVI